MDAVLKTDVIIVGAGPTGLALAAQLVRYGIDFIILDKKDGCTDLSKALIVHARTLEIYDQIGLADRAVQEGKYAQKLTLLHHGDVSAQVDFSGFGKRLSPFPFLLVFEQSKNERLLYGHLQEQGQEVQWQTELEQLIQDPDGVRAQLRGVDGSTHVVEGRYLVGCDGAGSRTRHLLGLGFEGSTTSRLFYVADVEMEFEKAPDSLYVCFGPNSFVVMFPMEGEKHWRLIGNYPEFDESVQDTVVYEKIENKVRELVQLKLDITKVRWFSTYKVHTRHAEKFQVGRCFLAGDAAHVHTPVGGQGMNTGIQDAYNLAWKLAVALRFGSGDSLLETYNEERLANAELLLKTTDEFFDVGTGGNWYLQFFRDHVLPGLFGFATQFHAAQETLFTRISQIGINYRESSLSQLHHENHYQVQAGDRMPFFKVGEESVFDRLRAPRFHWLTFTPGVNGEVKLNEKWKGLVDTQNIPLSPEVSEVFGSTEPFQVLLRPDNYIGLIAKDLSPKIVEDYLNKLLD